MHAYTHHGACIWERVNGFPTFYRKVTTYRFPQYFIEIHVKKGSLLTVSTSGGSTHFVWGARRSSAEGAMIEAPKAPRRVGRGEEVSPFPLEVVSGEWAMPPCRAVLVDGPSFPLLCVARTDLGMPMDAILVTIPGSER